MGYLVSVIIPVYNVEGFLDKCINSIVNQTYRTLEILLIDDGSNDRSSYMCDKWRERDDRIKVIHKKNEGVGIARNTGIEVSLGEYITFVDSDDYLETSAIETMVRIIEEDNSDLVIAQNIKVYSDGRMEKSQYEWMHNMILTRDEAMQMVGSNKMPLPASVWSKLYRRQVFNEIRFPNLKCGEDTYMLPHIIEKCNLVSITNAIVYYYFQRESSIVHNMNKERELDSMKSVLHVARILYDNKYIEGAKIYYNSALIKVAKMKYDKEARNIIRNFFNKNERKILNKKNIKMWISIILYSIPGAYKLYKMIKK